jgi:DNA modification methylase
MSSKKLKIENWAIEKLIPYARNPRKNDQAVEQVAAAIKEFGFRVPIVAKSDGLLVDGHLRLKAAQKLGLKEVPVVLADDLSDAQIKAFRISVNRMAELAEWDNELLALEFAELKDLGFDTSLTGFDDAMVSEIMPTEAEPLTDEDAVPEVDEQSPPKTKIGDVWILGNHRVMCGDSTNEAMVAKLMNGVKADMVFTDPPYGVEYRSNMTKRFDVLINDNVILDIHKIVLGMMKQNSAAFIWTSHHVYPIWRDQFKDSYKQTLIWSKGGSGMGDLNGQYALNYEMALFCTNGKPEFKRKRGMAVWQIGKDAASDYVHPTQKPVALAENAIEDFTSTNEKVLDLFLGSGSTLIACEKTGRKCYGMELSPQYIEVIIRRWQEYTGKEAHLEETGETFNSIAQR